MMRIRILLLIKAMQIWDHWSTDPPRVQGPVLSLKASIVSVHGPPKLHSELPQLLSFDLDSDPASNVESDPDLIALSKAHLWYAFS
jgi:hypothetical protein